MNSFADTSALPFVHDYPEPRPDELLVGWRGRLRALEYLARSRDVDTMLRGRLASKLVPLRKQADFVDLAAAMLGRSASDIWRGHTMIPFFKPFASNRKLPAERWVDNSIEFRTKHSFQYGSAYPVLCQKCVHEDLAYFLGGFSYWRRSHHLPGVLWCTKHQHPLLQVADGDAFAYGPHIVMDRATPILDDVYSLMNNPVVLRYVEIATEVLLSAPLIDSAHATAAFKQRALAAGIRVAEKGRGMTVSQVALESAPIEWLSLALPRIDWTEKRYIWGTDNACTGNSPRYTANTFCLITALLYDAADEAAHELYGHPFHSGSRSAKANLRATPVNAI
jgi:hypothetical protein